MDYPHYAAHSNSVFRRLQFDRTLIVFEEYSPKFHLFHITLVGPEPVPTLPNLVIQCCYQVSIVVTQAAPEHFFKKKVLPQIDESTRRFLNQLSYF